jgi:hypothetical protein
MSRKDPCDEGRDRAEADGAERQAKSGKSQVREVRGAHRAGEFRPGMGHRRDPERRLPPSLGSFKVLRSVALTRDRQPLLAAA